MVWPSGDKIARLMGLFQWLICVMCTGAGDLREDRRKVGWGYLPPIISSTKLLQQGGDQYSRQGL